MGSTSVGRPLPPLAVSLFLPRQESGNPGYEYPLVGLHRGIKVRYKSFIRLVMHSLRPIRRGLLVMVVFAAELAVEPPLSGVRPVDLCVSLASVGKPIGLPRRKNRCARAGGRASRRAGQISGIPTTISSHRSGRVRLRSVPGSPLVGRHQCSGAAPKHVPGSPMTLQSLWRRSSPRTARRSTSASVRCDELPVRAPFPMFSLAWPDHQAEPVSRWRVRAAARPIVQYERLQRRSSQPAEAPTPASSAGNWIPGRGMPEPQPSANKA